MKLIYFWASWHYRSKLQKDLIEKFCEDNDIDYKSINVDDDETLLEDYNIKQIPATLVLNDFDVPVVTHYGQITEEKLTDIINKI